MCDVRVRAIALLRERLQAGRRRGVLQQEMVGDIAERIGVAAATVEGWLYGKTPSRRYAEEMIDLLDRLPVHGRDQRTRAREILADVIAVARRRGCPASALLAPIATRVGVSVQSLRRYVQPDAPIGRATARAIVALADDIETWRRLIGVETVASDRAAVVPAGGTVEEARLRLARLGLDREAIRGIEVLQMEQIGEAYVSPPQVVESWVMRAPECGRAAYAVGSWLPQVRGAHCARRLCEVGFVHLFQRRMGAGRFLYLMQRRPIDGE